MPTIVTDAKFPKNFGTVSCRSIDASTNKKLSLAPETNEKKGKGSVVLGADVVGKAGVETSVELTD
jgi:hypothetical protein